MGFKSVPYSTTVCGTNCEGCGSITLTAPNDATYSTTFTSIVFASYGTPNGSCGAFTYGGCHAGSSFGVVSGAFIGRTSGSVNPVNGTFGDPCFGTYKRLYIQLTASGTQQVFVPIPVINSFVASPNPQTSSSGTPLYTTSLSWSTTNGSGGSATITSNAGETWNVSSLGGNLNISNLPQSTTGSNSPATRTYTLTVKNEINESVTSTITVSAYNDNVPNDYSVPSQVNQNPGTLISWTFGPITGIDMPTVATVQSGADISINGSNWSNTVLVSNNQTVFLRTTTLPFNTSPLSLPNTKSLYVDVGPLRRFFSVTTRQPNIEELFDFGDSNAVYPFPDIDQVSNTPQPYVVSPTTIVVDNVELSTPYGTEIVTDNSEAQVRVKTFGTSTFGPWQYLREGLIEIPFGSLQARSGVISNSSPTLFNTRNVGVITATNTTA